MLAGNFELTIGVLKLLEQADVLDRDHGLMRERLDQCDLARTEWLSNATVKTHINRIFAKTGARDRAQAVRFAYQHGLATPAP